MSLLLLLLLLLPSLAYAARLHSQTLTQLLHPILPAKYSSSMAAEPEYQFINHGDYSSFISLVQPSTTLLLIQPHQHTTVTLILRVPPSQFISLLDGNLTLGIYASGIHTLAIHPIHHQLRLNRIDTSNFTSKSSMSTVLCSTTTCMDFIHAGYYSLHHHHHHHHHNDNVLTSVTVSRHHLLWIMASDSTLSGPFHSGHFDLDPTHGIAVIIIYYMDALRALQPHWINQDTFGKQTFLLDWSTPRQFQHAPTSAIQMDDTDAVTLVTQLTVDRMRRFIEVAHLWSPFPVSACIYLSDPLDLLIALGHLNTYTDKLTPETLYLTLIQPAYDDTLFAAQHQQAEADASKRFWTQRYPINLLRNVALIHSPTDLVFVMDVDFIPAKTLASYAQRIIAPTYRHMRLDTATGLDDALAFDAHTFQTTFHADDPEAMIETVPPMAFVIPVLGIREEFMGSVPSFWQALEWIYTHLTSAIYTFERSGHDPTRLDYLIQSPSWFDGMFRWRTDSSTSEHVNEPESSEYERLNARPLALDWELGAHDLDDRGFVWRGFTSADDDAHRFMRLCYEHQWEPYYIVPKRVLLEAGSETSRQVAEYWQGVWEYFDTHQPNHYVPEATINVLRQKTGQLRHATASQQGTVHLESALLYDLRFENQGGDKQSHALFLNQLNTKFYLVKKQFMIHLDHKHGMPSPRHSGSLKAVRVRASAPSETVAVKLKQAKLMNYFDEYLPFMERLFGRGFRWGKQCRWHWLYDQQRPVAPLES